MKRIVIERSAQKVLMRTGNKAENLIQKIEQYAFDSASLANNVKKLKGRRAYRLRVGHWRIIFTETSDTVTILDIGTRGSIYD